MLLFVLFYEFLLIGLFSVGGGLATLPYLYKLIDKYHWFTNTELVDMIAISESTPGPLGVNMATFAGFNANGILGGIVATLGLVCAALLVTLPVSFFLDKFKNSILVKKAFYGIRPAVAALILTSAWGIIETSLLQVSGGYGFNLTAIIIFLLSFLAIRKFKKHPIFYIITGAIIAMFIPL